VAFFSTFMAFRGNLEMAIFVYNFVIAKHIEMSDYIFKIPKVSLSLQTPADKHGECGIYIRIPFDGRWKSRACVTP